MPATRDPAPQTLSEATARVLLSVGLVLCVIVAALVVFVCNRPRRGLTGQARNAPSAPTSERPRQYETHLEENLTEKKLDWKHIQPLALNPSTSTLPASFLSHNRNLSKSKAGRTSPAIPKPAHHPSSPSQAPPPPMAETRLNVAVFIAMPNPPPAVYALGGAVSVAGKHNRDNLVIGVAQARCAGS